MYVLLSTTQLLYYENIETGQTLHYEGVAIHILDIYI